MMWKYASSSAKSKRELMSSDWERSISIWKLETALY